MTKGEEGVTSESLKSALCQYHSKKYTNIPEKDSKGGETINSAPKSRLAQGRQPHYHSVSLTEARSQKVPREGRVRDSGRLKPGVAL